MRTEAERHSQCAEQKQQQQQYQHTEDHYADTDALPPS